MNDTDILAADTQRTTQIMTQKKPNMSRSRFIPNMVSLFVQLIASFIKRDEKPSQESLGAKYIDWFWLLAAETYNCTGIYEINENMIVHDELYPEGLQSLDLFYRYGFTVRTTKRKTEFGTYDPF